jgi:hypothetical protein
LGMNRVYAKFVRVEHAHEGDRVGIVLRTTGGDNAIILSLDDIERIASAARSRIDEDRDTERLLAAVDDLREAMLDLAAAE